MFVIFENLRSDIQEIFMILKYISNISPRVFNRFYLYELFERNLANYI